MKKRANTNLASLLSDRALKCPNAIALYWGDEIITYRTLDELVWRCSTLLHRQGISLGDIVFSCFEDELLQIVSMLACARLGMTLVSIPIALPLFRLAILVERLFPAIWISDVSKSPSGVDGVMLSIEILNDESMLQVDENIAVVNPVHPWQIVIGSGTTGEPKLFEVSHALELNRIKLAKTSINMSSSDIVASMIPMQFNTAKIRFLAALSVGAQYVLLNPLENTRIDMYEEKKITLLYTTVFHVEKILHTLDIHSSIVFRKLRVLSVGGSTISENLRARIIKHLTPNLYVGYGTNDVGGITCTTPEDILTTLDTVGKPIKGVKVEIVDDNDTLIKDGKIGHIRLKSPGVIPCYMGDEKFNTAFFKGGWFYPGDLGRWSEDFQLIYCGRSDHMMIMNGINIYPAEIESVLSGHPCVADVAVVPFQHFVFGDLPVAAVVLRENYAIFKDELYRLCVERLGFRSPKEIIFLPQIPRNDLGKLQRNVLKEQLSKKFEKPLLENQLRRKLSVWIAFPPYVAMEKIDQWLHGYDIIVSLDKHPFPVIARVLMFYTMLLQRKKITINDTGECLSVVPHPEKNSTFLVELDLVHVDTLSNETYKNLLIFAFNSIFWMAQSLLNDANKQLFDKCLLEQDFGKEISK